MLATRHATGLTQTAARSRCIARAQLASPPPARCRRSIRAAYMQASQDQVRDVMVKTDFVTCRPTDTVDTVLELLVKHQVTGVPVLDEGDRVVGVVSDYDLLARNLLSFNQSGDLFPDAEQTWQAFKQFTKALAKGTGKLVADVMTCDPITVTPTTCIDDATSLLIKKGIRRMPVVDEQGHLVGMLSRRDVVRAALHSRRGFCGVDEMTLESLNSRE